MLPHLTKCRSTLWIQWTDFALSKKYLSETISKNIPPNAVIVPCTESRSLLYSSGSCKAMVMISKGETQTAALTINIGSTKRVPNTASRIPHVRKRFCHTGVIFLRTRAFTTALSKESVTSRTERMTTKISASVPNPYHVAANNKIESANADVAFNESKKTIMEQTRKDNIRSKAAEQFAEFMKYISAANVVPGPTDFANMRGLITAMNTGIANPDAIATLSTSGADYVKP